MELNKIYNEDCLEFLKRMHDNSIDLIVTSPPYNKSAYYPKSANNNAKKWVRKIDYDVYSDDMTPKDYEAWQRNVLNECMRVLKPEGSIFYNHKDIYADKLAVAPKWVYDYPLHQQIIWDRGSSPSLDPHYFQPITEYIYWIVKDKDKTYFDKGEAIFRTNIWRMNFESNPHPAPFPLYLVQNIVKSACPRGGGGI